MLFWCHLFLAPCSSSLISSYNQPNNQWDWRQQVHLPFLVTKGPLGESSDGGRPISTSSRQIWSTYPRHNLHGRPTGPFPPGLSLDILMGGIILKLEGRLRKASRRDSKVQEKVQVSLPYRRTGCIRALKACSLATLVIPSVIPHWLWMTIHVRELVQDIQRKK